MKVQPGLKSYVKNYKLGATFKMSPAQRSSVSGGFKASRGIGIGRGGSATLGGGRMRGALSLSTVRELDAAAARAGSSPVRAGLGGRALAAIKAWQKRSR